MKMNQLSLVCVAFISSEQMWNKLQPLANKSISYYASTKNPESKDFWRKVTLRNSKIQSIVEDALTILGQSVLKGSIEEINNMGKRIKKLRADISDAQVARIGAPQSSWNPLEKTKSRLDSKIQKDEEKIREYEQGIQELKQAAVDNITDSGLNIPKKTIDYLCIAPNGSTISQIMSIGMNIKQMIGLVEEQFKTANADDLQQIAHTYAGLYFIGCRTQYEAYTIAIDEINNIFTPKLAKLEAATEQVLQETQKLLSQSSEENKDVVRNNLSIIERALTVIAEYRNYLKKHIEQLAQEKERQKEKMAMAVNTYKTVSVSSQLIGLIRNSVADLESLINFQIPDQNLIYSDIYRDEFVNLMIKLAEK